MLGFYSIQIQTSSTSVKSNVGALPKGRKNWKTFSVHSNLLERTKFPDRMKMCVFVWEYL